MKKIILSLVVLCSFSIAEEKKFCAAVRGNGEYMLAHFGALARITETYGTLDGIAGGSSASITSFLYESMLLNPAVQNCNGKPCSDKEKARRVALLLKAGPEVVEVMKKTSEALALKHLMHLQGEVKAKGIEVLFQQGKVKEASEALKTLLESKEFKSMINPEMGKLIALGRGKEVYDQIANYGKWKVDDVTAFFTPGFLNFRGAPDVFGKLGDFYAGRGPVDSAGMEKWFEACSGPETLGTDWYSLKDECHTDFNRLYSDFRSKYDAATGFDKRKNDPVGGALPTLISTSVLYGKPQADSWRKNQEEYWRKPGAKYDFNPGFDRIKFGYWGREADLKKMGKAFEDAKDLKSQKFLGLGQTAWKKVLDKSPAEPGLANGQPIDEDKISLGGWSDLHPVQALKAIGCKHVMYVTRRGPESTFAVSVAKSLGMSQSEEDKLFTLRTDGQPSSFQQALEMADAIFCTDWNISKVSDLKEMTTSAYNAPMSTRSAFFKKPLQGGVKEVVPNLKMEGCDSSSVNATAEHTRHRTRSYSEHY